MYCVPLKLEWMSDLETGGCPINHLNSFFPKKCKKHFHGQMFHAVYFPDVMQDAFVQASYKTPSSIKPWQSNFPRPAMRMVPTLTELRRQPCSSSNNMTVAFPAELTFFYNPKMCCSSHNSSGEYRRNRGRFMAPKKSSFLALMLSRGQSIGLSIVI